MADVRYEIEWRITGETKWRNGGPPSSEDAAKHLMDRWREMGYECQLVRVTTLRTVVIA